MTDINKDEDLKVVTPDISSGESDDMYATGSIGSLFAKVVIPSIIAMVIMGTQGIIDGLFLGNFIGPNAMASANIASPVNQILMALGMVIGIGGTAFIGRCLGENDIDRARDIFKSCYIAELIVAVVTVFLGLFFCRDLAKLFGANEVLIDGTADYIRVMLLLSPAILLYMLFSFTNRVIGKPNLFLYGSIASVFANVGFNYIFIVLLQWGMSGAALATSLSYTVGFLINVEPLVNKKTVVNIFIGKFNFDLLKKSLYNGSSEGITGVATGVTMLVFNLTFMHFYGEAGVSAFTIVNYIAQFTTLMMFGMSDGITPIISYNYGAGLFDRIKKIMTISIIVNLIAGIISFIVVIFMGETLIGFFAKGDTDLIELTYFGAKIYASSFLLCGFNIIVSAYFTAIGDALKSVFVSSSRGLTFILLGIVTLPYAFGVTGVWLVAPFADIVTVFISIYVLTKASNQQNKIKGISEDGLEDVSDYNV